MKKIVLILSILLFFVAFGETVQNSIDWSQYKKDIAPEISKNWNPFGFGEEYKATVTFVIGKNGELLANKIKKSSGNIDFDNFVLSTINKSAPFKALPKEYYGESITMDYGFKYEIQESPVLNEEIIKKYEAIPTQNEYLNINRKNSVKIVIKSKDGQEYDWTQTKEYLIKQIKNKLEKPEFKEETKLIIKIKTNSSKEILSGEVLLPTARKKFDLKALLVLEDAIDSIPLPKNLNDEIDIYVRFIFSKVNLVQ